MKLLYNYLCPSICLSVKFIENEIFSAPNQERGMIPLIFCTWMLSSLFLLHKLFYFLCMLEFSIDFKLNIMNVSISIFNFEKVSYFITTNVRFPYMLDTLRGETRFSWPHTQYRGPIFFLCTCTFPIFGLSVKLQKA